MSALTYSWYVSNVQCVGSTTRPLPSHSAQMKETRRSLYDSESGVKKMAVGHHLSERSHTIVRSHNLLSGKRAERKDLTLKWLVELPQDTTLSLLHSVLSLLSLVALIQSLSAHGRADSWPPSGPGWVWVWPVVAR